MNEQEYNELIKKGYPYYLPSQQCLKRSDRQEVITSGNQDFKRNQHPAFNSPQNQNSIINSNGDTKVGCPKISGDTYSEIRYNCRLEGKYCNRCTLWQNCLSARRGA